MCQIYAVILSFGADLVGNCLFGIVWKPPDFRVVD